MYYMKKDEEKEKFLKGRQEDVRIELLHQKELLEKILEMSEKNKKELESIRRYMRRMFVSKVIYWSVIVIITAGAVYAARPYVQKGVETYQSVKSSLDSTSQALGGIQSSFKDVQILQKIFELK